MLRGFTKVVCALLVTGCSSSATLTRQGNLAAACVKARDESPQEQRVLQERLLADLAPRIALVMVDPARSKELERLVGNRYDHVRFARLSVALDPSVKFDARITLENLRDEKAYYSVGYVDEYVAADLVAPRPEGGLADLALVSELLLKGSLNLTLISICAGAREAPNCLGLWMETESEARRRKLASVDAEPELRRRKEELLRAAKDGPPLLALVPNAASRLHAPVVVMGLKLQTRFGRPGAAACTHNVAARIEWQGNDIDEVLERELSAPPRPLRSFHPVLEHAPDDALGE